MKTTKALIYARTVVHQKMITDKAVFTLAQVKLILAETHYGMITKV